MTFIDRLNAAASGRPILVTAIGVGLISALMISGYLLFLRNPYQVLFDKMRVNDAAAVVAELDREKVPYRLEAGGSRILVPARKVDAARLNIMSADLPLKGTVGFELFNKSDMGLTEFAQKINYQRALQGELARTIMSLDAVEAARVHLSLPDSSIFRDDRRPPKASITLTMRPGRRLSPEMVAGVQNLVATSTPDLEAANVFVLDEQGAIVSQNALQTAASTASGIEANVEQYYASRIRQAVSRVYPDSDLEVSIQVTPRHTSASAAITPAPAASDGDDDPANADNAKPAPPQIAPSDDLQNALQSWTPASRRFAVQATLSVNSPISLQLQQQMKLLAAQAVGIDTAGGDLVVVSASQDGGTVEPDLVSPEAGFELNPTPSPTKPSSAANLSPSIFWEVILTPALVILFGLAIWLGRRRGHARSLNERERSDYVVRLKFLLEQEEASAAPPR